MDQRDSGRARLAQWIERSKINQLEAAEIIGMDKTQLCQILLGHRRPGLDNAVKIERATGVVAEAWATIADGEQDTVGAVTGRKPLSGKA